MYIFFDVDGTLVDYEAAEKTAALQFLDNFSGVLPFEREAFASLWHDLMTKHYARFLAGEIDWAGQRRKSNTRVVPACSSASDG